jgi:transketolase
MTEVPYTEYELSQIAGRARQSVVRLGYAAAGQGAHYGPALSLIEILTALYGSVPGLSSAKRGLGERDRMILSKGHGSLGLYAVLHEFGFIDDETLALAETDGSALPGQPKRDLGLGIEFSSGSLGMGLSFGLGLALSARLSGHPRRVFVVMGDGETNEGSVWEAAMSAAHFGLDNVVAMIDVNNLQSDGPTTEVMSCDLAAAWRGFGWAVDEVDGHSLSQLREAITSQPDGSRPRCILAHTRKGKGVSFMEGVAEWHHGLLTSEQYQTASTELGMLEEPS